MEPKITVKNTALPPEARQYVERKLGKLEHLLPNIIESKVEIIKEKTKSPQQRFVAQVTIDSKGTLLRGEERGETLLAAVDKVAAIMERQAERFKGKLYDKGRGNSLARNGFPEATKPSATQRVVKVKQFVIKPMSVGEAIEQMELLSHSFFLFFNTDSDKLNLVYQRKDGNYGLIEPELS
ncbi:ribosome hibernation-promoting factor, HPF/YfiA family [Chloroflexota bacterium]